MTTATIEPPATPELDKMLGLTDESHRIGEFVDWLFGQGLHLVKYEPVVKERWPRQSRIDARGDSTHASFSIFLPTGPDEGVHGPPEEYVDEDNVQALPWREGIEQMLARFYDIDLNVIEEERRAVLAFIRAQ